MRVLECRGDIPFSSAILRRRAIRHAQRQEKELLATQPEVKVAYVGGATIADMARDEMALIESERIQKCAPKPVPVKKADAERRSEKVAWCVSKLMSLIDMRGPSECWPWRGTIVQAHPKYTSTAYPRAYGFDPMHAEKPRSTYAYRLVYILMRGPIPAGMTVDHVCFNPLCCNPDHLQLLTRSENSARKNPDRKKQSGPGSDTPAGQ